MRTRLNHTLVTATLVAAVSLLAACGGGGGDTPTPVTPPNPASTGSLTAAARSGTINADLDSWSATVTISTSNVAAADGATVKSNGVVIHSGKTSGTITVPVKVGTTAVTLWDGSKQLATVNLTGSCAPTLTPDGAGICRAPVVGVTKFWPPTSVAKLTTTVTLTSPGKPGANQLPVGCKSVMSECWQTAIKNGTVKYADTGIVIDNRNTVVALYYNSVGNYNRLLQFANNGEVAGGDINDGIIGDFTKMQGNTEGVVFQDASDNACYQQKSVNGFWSWVPTTCPVF